METNRAREIIVEVIQKALIGQLKSSSNINPKDIADAISAKVNFEKTFSGSKNDQIIGTLIDVIVDKRKETTDELKKLNQDEKLLANFIRGKLTSYNEILKVLKNL